MRNIHKKILWFGLTLTSFTPLFTISCGHETFKNSVSVAPFPDQDYLLVGTQGISSSGDFLNQLQSSFQSQSQYLKLFVKSPNKGSKITFPIIKQREIIGRGEITINDFQVEDFGYRKPIILVTNFDYELISSDSSSSIKKTNVNAVKPPEEKQQTDEEKQQAQLMQMLQSAGQLPPELASNLTQSQSSQSNTLKVDLSKVLILESGIDWLEKQDKYDGNESWGVEFSTKDGSFFGRNFKTGQTNVGGQLLTNPQIFTFLKQWILFNKINANSLDVKNWCEKLNIRHDLLLTSIKETN